MTVNNLSSLIKAIICSAMFLLSSEAAVAGSGTGPGKTSCKNQAASVFQSGSNWLTMGSWLLSFLSKPNPIGPTTDALEVAKTFADGAEGYVEALPKINSALDLSLAVVVGEGQTVRSESDLKLIKRTVLEQTGQLNFDGFGLTRSQINDLVEKRIEDRGLKGW